MRKVAKLNVSKTFFANSIAYSSSNEDSYSELKALNITENDSIVCVTASGDRVINLLLKKPKKMVAIDLNPFQNYLLELKLAGIKHLSYDDFLEFLGVKNSDRRLLLYDQLKQSLSEEAKAFWDKGGRTTVSRGVIYQGNLERFLWCFAIMMRLFRSNKVKKIFSFNSIEQQRKFFDTEWNNTSWKIITRLLFSKLLCKNVLKDPGFYHYVPGNVQVHEYLRNKVNHTLRNHLAKDNFYAALFLYGKYLDGMALPQYLEEDNFNFLKENISAFDIDIVLEPLEKYFRTVPKESVDKFSLSDVSAFLDEESYKNLLESVHAAGSPGSIFCLRHFITKRRTPESIKKKYKFNPELEKELEYTDRTFVYSFKIGQKI